MRPLDGISCYTVPIYLDDQSATLSSHIRLSFRLISVSITIIRHVLKHQGCVSVSVLHIAPYQSLSNPRNARRFRPPNAIEQREGGENVVAFSDNLQTVQIRSAQLGSGPEKDGFTFDRVFPPGTKQQEVFEYGVKE